MRSFSEILDIAADRKGGRAAVLNDIPEPKTPDQIAAIPDDRWLAAMARGIFQAGFSWKVIEAKWPGFEAAFDGFAVAPLAFMPDDMFDTLLADKRIVRNGQKIRAVHENAVFIQEVVQETGSFGRKVADWPGTDFAGLIQWLAKDGARLGGTTGPYMLRTMGKDGYILSRDVTARLIAEGVIDKPPTSQKAMRAVQDAFNTWADQSGASLTTISRVLAQSIG